MDTAPSSPPAAPEAASSIWLMGLGVLLGLIGSVLINVGNNVQALGMGMVEEQKQQWTLSGLAPSRRPKRIIWAGTTTFILGSVINFVAFVFAAAAVLAPLEAIQFVSNLLFARYVTKAVVSRKMVAGSALIVAGTIGAVASGPFAVFSFSTEQLCDFWRSPTWLVFVVAAWLLSIAMQVFWRAQMRRMCAGGRAYGPPVLMPVLYAVSSALVGTQSVVQAKAFSELIELWISGQEMIWSHWFTYATLGYFGVTVAFWLYRLNAALGKYDALYIIPMLQASYIVLATVAGGIFFQEFQTLEWWQLLLFFGCIMVMFGGLYLLIPTITIAPPQSSTRSSNAHSGSSELELCPAPAMLDCAAAKTSILYTEGPSSNLYLQNRPKTSVLAVVAKAGQRHARAKQPIELSGVTPRLAEGPEDDADWLWKTPSGNGFFRVAHSVSFANTGSFADTSAANATTAEPGGAAADININSALGSGSV